MSNTNTKDKIKQEVRLFFKNISWKNSLTFLFFLLLSSIFWTMQIYREKFETNHTIPIKYVNVPDSIIFENDLPQKINALIKDDGAAIIKYYFTKKHDSLEIDIKDIVTKSESARVAIQGENIIQRIREKLYPTSDLISYSPALISFSYTVIQQKILPVIYDGHIELAQGYMIDGDISLTPDQITVYGSQATLDTLSFIHTVPDTIIDLNRNRIQKISIKPNKHLKFVPNEVELSVPVEEVTTKRVYVPITCINLPENLGIKTFPSSIELSFSVSLKKYNSVTADDFKITIDYNEIKDSKNPVVAIRITESPDYIRTRTLNLSPSEVEFIFEQQ